MQLEMDQFGFYATLLLAFLLCLVYLGVGLRVLRTKGGAAVFLWSAGCESPRGDRVEYWLKYEYPKDSGPMSARPPLQVVALYFTAPTVNRIREQVRRSPQ